MDTAAESISNKLTKKNVIKPSATPSGVEQYATHFYYLWHIKILYLLSVSQTVALFT